MSGGRQAPSKLRCGMQWLRPRGGVRKEPKHESAARSVHALVGGWRDRFGYSFVPTVVVDRTGMSLRGLPELHDGRLRDLLAHTGACRARVNVETETLELSRKPEPFAVLSPQTPRDGPWSVYHPSFSNAVALVHASRVRGEEINWTYSQTQGVISFEGLREITWPLLQSLLSQRFPFTFSLQTGRLSIRDRVSAPGESARHLLDVLEAAQSMGAPKGL